MKMQQIQKIIISTVIQINNSKNVYFEEEQRIHKYNKEKIA